jgi:hypothetical protein
MRSFKSLKRRFRAEEALRGVRRRSGSQFFEEMPRYARPNTAVPGLRSRDRAHPETGGYMGKVAHRASLAD